MTKEEKDKILLQIAKFAEETGIPLYTQEQLDDAVKKAKEGLANTNTASFGESEDGKKLIEEAVKKALDKQAKEFEFEKKKTTIALKFGIPEEKMAEIKTEEQLTAILLSDEFKPVDTPKLKNTGIVGASFGILTKEAPVNPMSRFNQGAKN